MLCIFLGSLSASTPAAAVKIVHMRCEYLTNPIGVDEPAPRLSWELQSSRRGFRQTAYRILAASERRLLAPGKADLWDSGKVASAATCQIAYAGNVLRPLQHVWWTVQVWDEEDRASGWSEPAHWTCGPVGAWSAQWIGDPQRYPEALPARNGYHTELADRPEQEKWVQIELDAPATMDGVRLWPARPYDWQPDTPGFLFPLRFRIEGANSTEGPFHVLVDRTAADCAAPAAGPLTVRFPPATVQRLRLVVTALRERDRGRFGMALAEMEGLHGDEVITAGARVTALDSIETGPWAAANLTDGDRQSHPAEGVEPLPPICLRREFTLSKVPSRMTLFASALGVYEVRINGRRVGDHILAPEWTDYRVRVQYQGYDVTRLLEAGRNVITAVVGDGWYAGRIGLFPGRGHYGRRPEFLAQLHADDDPKPVLVTDGAWRISTSGPIRISDILDGEVYDARMEFSGWDAAGFDDGQWTQVATYMHPGIRLVAQPNEPIRVTRELKPTGLTEPKPGVFIYDLGQNMVGWVRFRLQAAAGTVVRLRHGEMLDEDGTLYTENLRGAAQSDWYTCRGDGTEVFEPHFTYHGFRYVEVTGLPSRPKLEDLTGRVFHSSAPEVGSFACSDPSLNRLWQNILWTQRANLMSTPTDCPQRDERLGWMGDIQAFGQTACFDMDMAGFFTKWLQDVRDAQAEDGRYPDFAPNPGDSNKRFSGTPAWGDAGVVIPWLVYANYGDRRLLEKHYDSVLRWIRFIHEHNPDLTWRNDRGNDYNDWLNGDTLIAEGWPRKGAEVPREVFATAFWANSTRLTARMARVLGKDEDAEWLEQLHEGIRQAFNREFVQADGTILGNTQAGYALALHFDLLPPDLRSRAVEHMLAGIEAYGGHISTGIQSTHRMMLELSRAGRSDVAYRLLLNRTFPSWLYSIDNGATTIWERWDGYVKGRGFQNPGMNSFNHWALGAVGEWMMRTIIGLEPGDGPEATALTAWQRFRVAPIPGGGLGWARGSYRSIHGPIEVAWKAGPGAFALDISVPPNCTADVTLPGAQGKTVLEGGRPVADAPCVNLIGPRDDSLLVHVESGRYHFTWR